MRLRIAILAALVLGGLVSTPSSASRRPEPQRPVVVQVSAGFSWRDALIGAAAASGLWLVVAGSFVISTRDRGGKA